jgi:hypothetical protein
MPVTSDGNVMVKILQVKPYQLRYIVLVFNYQYFFTHGSPWFYCLNPTRDPQNSGNVTSSERRAPTPAEYQQLPDY